MPGPLGPSGNGPSFDTLSINSPIWVPAPLTTTPWGVSARNTLDASMETLCSGGVLGTRSLRLGPPAGRGRRAKTAKRQDVVDLRILHWHLDVHFFLILLCLIPPWRRSTPGFKLERRAGRGDAGLWRGVRTQEFDGARRAPTRKGGHWPEAQAPGRVDERQDL